MSDVRRHREKIVSNDYGRKWAAGVRALIMRRLRLYGAQTPQQLADGLKLSVEAIAPRMTELEASGEAFDTGERRSRFGRGRKQKVWSNTHDQTEL